jgi:iron complex outermembrane recepter protein
LKTKQRRVFTLPVVMLLGWSWHTAGAQALQSFDLPAQSLADSLRAVAARTNSNILFDKNLVSGVSARPLRGRVSTEEALTTILSGTDLHAHRLDDKTVTILPSRSKPAESPGTVPGATSYVRATDIRLAQANTSTTSDYTAESTIPAKADTTRRSEASDQLESVVVTGSRLAPLGFREPTPVTVVGAEEIKLSGTVNIEQLLGDSPQFVGSQNNGATANTVPGGTATLNLRGFGAQRNLVLVNGRRFAISGPDETTDINTIPAALIQRTEIVTGGSSAVYGSDAITGVVNFIMRDDFEGVELNAQDGFDQHTRTQVYNLDITGGGKFAEGRGNVVVSANFLNRGAISRGDRGDWAFDSLSDGCVTPASSNRSHAGVPVAISSGSTCAAAGGVPGLIAGGSGDIPNGRFTGVPTVGSSGSNPALDAALTAAGLGGLGSRGFTFDNAGQIVRPALTPQDDYNLGPSNYLIIPQKRWMVNAFSHYDFNDKMTGYAELHFSNNIVNMQLAPTNINGPFLINVNNPYLSPQMQGVLNQLDLAEKGTTKVTTGTSSMTTTRGDGLAILNVGRRLLEVGLRTNEAERNVWRDAVGIRGNLGNVSSSYLRNLSYDVYYTYARTEETDHEDGNVSRSRFQAGLLSAGGAAPVLDIFGQNISQTGVDAIAIGATNITRAEQQVAAGNLSGEAFDLPAGAVDFSTGVEWRHSAAKFIPDEFLSSGDVVGFNPGLPTGGSVAVREVYGEIGIPLLADLPFIKKLTTNAAFRHSKYDLKGVGGVNTYSFGAGWQVNSQINFRGQFQHSVRAPNVGELFGGLSQSFDAAVDPCSDRQPAALRTAAVRAACIATGVPAAQVFTAGVQSNNIIGNLLGGNPNVGVEKSDTRTFGMVLSPAFLSGLDLSIDYFNIKLNGAIAALGGGIANTLNLCYNVIQDANSPYCQAIRRNPVTGEIAPPYYITITNANTGGLQTSGVDLDGRYHFNLGAQAFDITSDWTWTHDFTSTPVQALPNVKNYCAGAFGPTCGQPIPQFKGATRATWHTGPLSVSLRHRFINTVTVDSYLLPKRAGKAYPSLSTLVNPVIPSQSYLDLSFAWDVLQNVQLYGGLQNIFDKDPPIVGSSSPSANTFAATYDVLGRQFFFGVTAKF